MHADAHNAPENTNALGDDEQKVQPIIAQARPLKVIADLHTHPHTHTNTRTHAVIKCPKGAPQIYNKYELYHKQDNNNMKAQTELRSSTFLPFQS